MKKKKTKKMIFFPKKNPPFEVSLAKQNNQTKSIRIRPPIISTIFIFETGMLRRA